MAAESKLEQKLREKAEEMGLIFLKVTSPGYRGIPDRMVIGNGGKKIFMELKAPGEKPGPRQVRVHMRLRSMDHPVHVVDNYADGERILKSAL